MKTAEVQKLAVGTKLYAVEFDPSGSSVVAAVRECEVVLCDMDLKTRYPVRFFTYRGRKCRRSVQARHCHTTEDAARAELVRLVEDKRNQLAGILAGLASFTTAAARG